MVQSKLNSPFVTQNIVFSFNRPRAKFFGCFLGRAMASMEASQKRGKKHLCLFQLSVILFWERFPLFRELFFVFFFSVFFWKVVFFFSLYGQLLRKSLRAFWCTTRFVRPPLFAWWWCTILEKPHGRRGFRHLCLSGVGFFRPVFFYAQKMDHGNLWVRPPCHPPTPEALLREYEAHHWRISSLNFVCEIIHRIHVWYIYLHEWLIF